VAGHWSDAWTSPHRYSRDSRLRLRPEGETPSHTRLRVAVALLGARGTSWARRMRRRERPVHGSVLFYIVDHIMATARTLALRGVTRERRIWGLGCPWAVSSHPPTYTGSKKLQIEAVCKKQCTRGDISSQNAAVRVTLGDAPFESPHCLLMPYVTKGGCSVVPNSSSIGEACTGARSARPAGRISADV
jgi:hypothetical protein